MFLIAVILIVVQSDFWKNGKFCWLRISCYPIWFEPAELFIYNNNVIFYSIGGNELHVAIDDDNCILLDVKKQPIGFFTMSSHDVGFYRYSLNEEKYINCDHIYGNNNVFVRLSDIDEYHISSSFIQRIEAINHLLPKVCE